MTVSTVEADVAELNRSLSNATPAEIIAAAVRSVAPGRLAVVASFGTETAALLKFVADVDRSLPILFIDTGWLFAETLDYRETLTAHFGLSDVRAATPLANVLKDYDPQQELWSTNPNACCHIRKVAPLAEALKPFDAWINGRKRYQGGERIDLPAVETDGRRLKFNPLAHVSKPEVEDVFAAHVLPRHPLEARGFGSIGCMPCTSRTQSGEQSRAGRWRGSGKTECGIHTQLADVSGEGEPRI